MVEKTQADTIKELVVNKKKYVDELKKVTRFSKTRLK